MRLTSEQGELIDLVRRFLSERITSEYLKSRANGTQGYDCELRKDLKDLGLYELFAGRSPEARLVELALVAKECGRFLVPDAIIENVLIGSLLEGLLSDSDAKFFEQLIAPADGSLALAFPRCCSFAIDTGKKGVSGRCDWALANNGAKVFIGFADDDNRNKRAFIAPIQEGDHVKECSGLDLTTSLYAYSFKGKECSVLSLQSTLALEAALDSIKAAEVSGICHRVIEMTTEYAKSRQQFGAPIGSFQAIQHRLAEIYAETEALSALSHFAAWSFDSSPEQRRLTSRVAVLKAAELGPLVCEAAIQCHGGIGFTWEYDLHLFLRRARTIKAAFGLNQESAKGLVELVS